MGYLSSYEAYEDRLNEAPDYDDGEGPEPERCAMCRRPESEVRPFQFWLRLDGERREFCRDCEEALPEDDAAAEAAIRLAIATNEAEAADYRRRAAEAHERSAQLPLVRP